MVVGNIKFVAWTVLSDVFENMATLLSPEEIIPSEMRDNGCKIVL